MILAAAGLKRLGLENRIFRYFSPEEILPAAGQGILAVQGRAGENEILMEGFTQEETRQKALAERAFVRWLDGGCTSPVAAYADVCEGELFLKGLYYIETEGTYVVGRKSGDAKNAGEIGISLAKEMQECYGKKEESGSAE